MNPGEKEIEWGFVNRDFFDELLRRVSESVPLISERVGFYNFSLKMGVVYDNPVYRDLLMEKFFVTREWFPQRHPILYFVQNRESFGVELPFRNYGFVDRSNLRRALVFAPSFGVFKSVISGFASYCHEPNYYPIHASVIAVDSIGVAFIGGSMAGKTTTLINIVDRLQKQGRVVQVLADDWCVVRWRGYRGLIAQTFDPSVSFRKRDLDENPHILFPAHDWLIEQFKVRDKISVFPSILYEGFSVPRSVRIDRIVLLEPFPGPSILQKGGEKKVIAKKIIDAAYHYPYVSDSQRDRHSMFWCNVQKHVETFSLHTRSLEGGRQGLDALEELFA